MEEVLQSAGPIDRRSVYIGKELGTGTGWAVRGLRSEVCRTGRRLSRKLSHVAW